MRTYKPGDLVRVNDQVRYGGSSVARFAGRVGHVVTDSDAICYRIDTAAGQWFFSDELDPVYNPEDPT